MEHQGKILYTTQDTFEYLFQQLDYLKREQYALKIRLEEIEAKYNENSGNCK